MKFTLSWLKDYLTINNKNQADELDVIINGLLQIGLEVESVVNYKEELKDYTVAKILKAEPHPNANKLQVCEVETADGIKTIVCGAHNARAGIKVIYAKEGTYVKGSDITIKKTEIRGVSSSGMMVSERELCISDEHDGIIEINDEFKVGEQASTALGLDDIVIEVSITPNLGFLLGVKEIARELAALSVGEFNPHGKFSKHFNNNIFESGNAHQHNLNFNINTKVSSVFGGVIIKNVNNKIATPLWMQNRLKLVGQRSISPLVDITNYLLLDINHPMHVYDLATLGQDITVDKGQKIDTITTLKEQEYESLENIPVIKSNNQVISLAGVMGGLQHSSTVNTSNVLLECAVFDNVEILKSTRALKLNTDSSYRFARKVAKYDLKEAISIATNLIIEVCGGEYCTPQITGDITDNKQQIKVYFNEVNNILGVNIAQDKILDILTKYGFKIVNNNQDCIDVIAPEHREHIATVEDVYEVILNCYGLNNIPLIEEHYNKVTKFNNPSFERAIIARHSLAQQGMMEVINMSFISKEKAKACGGYSEELELSNPISQELAVMRGSLIPSLLANLSKNIKQGESNLSIFEVANTYTQFEENCESKNISGLLSGYKTYKDWQHKDEEVTVFDAKEKLFRLLEDLGTNPSRLNITQEDLPEYYHIGKAGVLWLGRTPLAYFGEIHPVTLKNFNIKVKTVVFELLIDNLPVVKAKSSTMLAAKQFSNQTPIHRDFAFILDDTVKSSEIIKIVSGVNKKLITQVKIFDVYKKDESSTTKSVAFTITIEPEQTLTDKEINEICDKVIEEVTNKLKGELRDK